MVYVMGTRTLGGTEFGLNRQRLNAEVVALSKIGVPVLWTISASVTLPLATSIVRTQTPLPVFLWRRASYGYSGLGLKTAATFAEDIEMGPVGPELSRRIGCWVTGFVLGRWGGGVGCSSINSG